MNKAEVNIPLKRIKKGEYKIGDNELIRVQYDQKSKKLNVITASKMSYSAE